MTVQAPDNGQPTGLTPQTRPDAAEVCERIETARLVGRRRHIWRVLSVLLASSGLLLMAVLVRRDQVRRESSLEDLHVLGAELDRWVHAQGSFPTDLRAVAGKGFAAMDQRYEYADVHRIDLARRWSAPVAIVFARKPVRLTLAQPGRGVILCRGGDFHVRWMNEAEFAQQRQKEQALLGKVRESSNIQVRPQGSRPSEGSLSAP